MKAIFDDNGVMGGEVVFFLINFNKKENSKVITENGKFWKMHIKQGIGFEWRVIYCYLKGKEIIL